MKASDKTLLQGIGAAIVVLTVIAVVTLAIVGATALNNCTTGEDHSVSCSLKLASSDV